MARSESNGDSYLRLSLDPSCFEINLFHYAKALSNNKQKIVPFPVVIEWVKEIIKSKYGFDCVTGKHQGSPYLFVRASRDNRDFVNNTLLDYAILSGCFNSLLF